jgi:hypothetical protein
MDPGAIAFGIAVAGAAVVWWLQPARRARRKLARAKKVRLAETRHGQKVAVRGVAGRAGQTLRSPLTGRECLAYSFTITKVEEKFGRIVSERAVPFVVAADGLELSVHGDILLGFELGGVDRSLCPGLNDLLAQRGFSQIGPRGEEVTFRCQEALLCAGDQISVLGRISLEVHPSGHRDGPRDQPVRRIMLGEVNAPVLVGV